MNDDFIARCPECPFKLTGEKSHVYVSAWEHIADTGHQVHVNRMFVLE